MPSLPFVRCVIFVSAFTLPLTACGSNKTETTSTIAMNNLDVVDGTTTDAMTDLDGVKSEGTAMVPGSAGNTATTSNAPKAAANASDPAEQADTEVIADQ
ncbi:MAG: hypothetical protein V4461_14825 [Pseudomonadota bacterium]